MIVRLRLFAAARQAARRAADEYELADGARVDDLVTAAAARYGDEFAQVLATARVWVNGDEPPDGTRTRLAGGDEVAVLPPVSGGATP